MKLEQANKIAGDFIQGISDLISSVEVCGSIRRQRPFPKDIDIVLIPKNSLTFKVDFIKRFKKSVKQVGDKLIRLEYKREQVDIYLANKKTFETLKLIRTGSMEHNIKLCTIAKNRNWHLYADGRGLYDENKNLISNTEKGILEALLNNYIEPEDRD